MKEIILSSAVLILVVVLLRRGLRGRIDPRVQYAVWLLAAVRLLVPGTLFSAPVSVAGAAAELETVFQERAQTPVFNAQNPLPAPTVGQDASVHAEANLDKSAAYSAGNDWLGIVWKTGMGVTGAALVLSNLSFYLALCRRRRTADVLCGPLRVYVVKGLASPCLFGVLRPAVYLTPDALENGCLDYVLAHEYTHFRHGDHLWALLRSVCLTVHWYNPLVWLAAVLSRRDCELACDAGTICRLGEERRLDYGAALLRMVTAGRSGLLCTATTMTAGKRTMGERVALIAKRPRMLKITLVLVVLVMCVLMALAFGGAGEKTEPDEPQDVSETEQEAETLSDDAEAPGSDPLEGMEQQLYDNAKKIRVQMEAGAAVEDWLPLMSCMDWAAIRAVAEDEFDLSTQVMEAIYNLIEERGVEMTMAQYIYILSATEGLDGAYAEGFQSIVYDLYAANPAKFAYVVLEGLTDAQRVAVVDFFRYEQYFQRADSEVLSAEETIAQLEDDKDTSWVVYDGLMTAKTLTSVGSTFQFPAAKTYGIYSATYASTDPDVAVVDQDGIVTAVGVGETTITMHYEGVGGVQDFSCEVICQW